MDLAITTEAAQLLGWFYAVTSALRVVAYAPQVTLVWRCRDGAPSVSLVTWISSAVSHFAATIYGLLVVADPCLCAISAGNAIGSVAIAWVATVRRVAARRAAIRTRSAVPGCLPTASTAPTGLPAAARRPAAANPSPSAAPSTTTGMPAHWQFRGQPAAA